MTNLQNGAAHGRGGADHVQHGAAHFVHDFAGIDLPLGEVVTAIDVVATPELLGRIVGVAWTEEMRVIDRLDGRSVGDVPTPHVDVAFGTRRSRNDAVILPVAWRSDAEEWVPPIDADLEFASFGPDRTHVHLYGSSELPRSTEPSTSGSSMAQRLTVAVVRHVLDLLTQRIVAVSAARPR